MLKEKLKGFVVGVVLTSLVVGTIPTMAEKVTKSAELLYNNIKVVIDGKQADLKDAQGNTVEPFIIDGTTYLPVRAVSNALNKAVSWDGATQTVYIGENKEIEQPSVWLKDLETFINDVSTYKDVNGYETSEVANDGSVYKNQITLDRGDVTYLLNGDYTHFKGTYFLTKENKDRIECASRIQVFGDDTLLYTSPSVMGGTTPIDFDVNVKGVYKLRIVLQGAAYLDRYDSESEWKWETLIDGKYVGAYNDGRKRVEKHATPIGNAGLYE